MAKVILAACPIPLSSVPRPLRLPASRHRERNHCTRRRHIAYLSREVPPAFCVNNAFARHAIIRLGGAAALFISSAKM